MAGWFDLSNLVVTKFGWLEDICWIQLQYCTSPTAETKFGETCQTKYIVIYSGLGLTRVTHPYHPFQIRFLKYLIADYLKH